MEFSLNRHSEIPIRRQLRGMIEYAISFGDLGIGAALPSVRDLAEQVGVAPMTVSQVYAELKRDGLVETRAGAGTFVADSARAQVAAHTDITELHGAIDRLLDETDARGIGLDDFRLLFNARLDHRLATGRRRTIVVAGLFDDATRSYADVIAAQIGPGASVQPVTVEALESDSALRSRTIAADMVVTFLTLRDRLVELLPGTKIVPIRFIPSEPTRLALASIDPMAPVAVVSHFPSFLPILRFGVQRFAAHCQDILAISEDDPALPDLLRGREVLIHATGAEGSVALAPPGITVIEYRHIPDPGDIDRLVKPLNGAAAQQTKRKEVG
jgi:DNA-binding transcriptional regulator YhcF (GntR family)